MMPDRPNGAELLEIARQVLRQELLPLIPEEHKLDALMVANTMAIAARELESGEAQRRETLTDLAVLYGEAPRPGEEAVMLAELTKRLRSAEHTSELQSLMRISYAVVCLTTKTKKLRTNVRNTHEPTHL